MTANLKHYIYSSLAIVAVMMLASCSSDNGENAGSKAIPMTFAASQEGIGGTRAAINTADTKQIVWKKNDAISIFDGNGNQKFILVGEGGSTSGNYAGTAAEATAYTAVYPYTSNATFSGETLSGVSLPSAQTATEGSFDPAAALMIASSTSDAPTKLQFKNIVGYVKVTPNFVCSKIELKAADETTPLAGTLSITGYEPYTVTDNKTYSISLTGSTTSSKAYYIAVLPSTLTPGWTISFTTSEGNVYTRKGSKSLTISRNQVVDLGSFDTSADYWYDEGRGDKVKASQEIDLGLTITKDNTTYKVIFAKSNLTATGLAESETATGDYFAWAATEPWYESSEQWKSGKEGGYVISNAPYYYTNTYDKTYTNKGQTLNTRDDAARTILGGNWQIPTSEIFTNLLSKENFTKEMTTNGSISGCKITNNSTKASIFLPATGYYEGKDCKESGTHGNYWLSDLQDAESAKEFYFPDTNNNIKVSSNYRYSGNTIRPIRLVKSN